MMYEIESLCANFQGGNDDDDALGGSMGLLSFKPMTSLGEITNQKAEASLLNFNTEVL
jgi:hypothetical protein